MVCTCDMHNTQLSKSDLLQYFHMRICKRNQKSMELTQKVLWLMFDRWYSNVIQHGLGNWYQKVHIIIYKISQLWNFKGSFKMCHIIFGIWKPRMKSHVVFLASSSSYFLPKMSGALFSFANTSFSSNPFGIFLSFCDTVLLLFP